MVTIELSTEEARALAFELMTLDLKTLPTLHSLLEVTFPEMLTDPELVECLHGSLEVVGPDSVFLVCTDCKRIIYGMVPDGSYVKEANPVGPKVN